MIEILFQLMFEFLVIMVWLCDCEIGCFWDIEQDFSIIVLYMIEEVYEVVDVIECKDMVDLQDEFGDFLFQVVFYVQMVKEVGLFDFDDVCCFINDKMICCYLYVFGDVSQCDIDV